MRSFFSRLVFSIMLTAVLASAAAGQYKPVPFAVGETLTYEGKISKIFPGISVADLTFTVENGNADGSYLIRAEARSKGTLLKLFRYSFLQKIDSTIAGTDLRALKTSKHDVQKERIRNSEAVFDYEQRRVTYTETDPNEPMRVPRMIASDLSGETHDLVSGIYSLRTLPLAVGKTFTIRVSDSGLIYDVPVRVTKRERQKTEIGKVWCFRIEPAIFGDGRMIEREGAMIIWVTDDARRIPVRSQVKASFGKLEIKLRSISKSAISANK